ncbi:hypothetical protein D9K80_14015 [Acinetobacter cumulans]|uniref:SGNH hydrolase-type esterase domain-containing protein n=1 Tax=Acinetobacter cumulans TaxID=2136182 RepID=A0A498CXZ1_9GAMM|nr:hypothetical protein [Acinetobacter cumulans]RLL32530.1 hypothetical protein D9K80_14015 [Acinetobacter cumulans]
MPVPTAAELTDPNATNTQMKQRLGQLAENVESKEGALEKANEARDEAISASAPLENFNVMGNPDNLVEIKDAAGRLIAAWNLKAEFVTKLLTDGIIQSVENGDGSSVLTLGNGREVDLYGTKFTLDLSNPDNALQLLAADNKVLFKIPLNGLDVDALLGAAEQINTLSGTLSSLKNAFLTQNHENGISKSEIFNSEKLSETRRKVTAIESGGIEQLVITSIGNSWLDTPSYLSLPLVRALKAKYGNAGAGYISSVRSYIDSAEAQLSASSGQWTSSNAALSDLNIPAPDIASNSSSNVGAYLQVTLKKGIASKVYLLADSTGAVVNVTKGGTILQTLTISSVITELPVTLDATSTQDSFRLEVVSGTATVYGFDLRNNQKGIRFNKCGAGGSRWTRWLNATASTWQAFIAHFNADLVIMLEGVNGSWAYDANAEKNYTEQMINRVRAATKNADIILMSPPDILASPTYTLRSYQDALRGKSLDWKVCHVDLQKTFGEQVSDYDDSGRQYILMANPNHPSDIGGILIASLILRLITG